MFYGKEMKQEKKNYVFFGIIGLIAIGLFIAASTTEASIVVAEMIANQISNFLLKGNKVNTV